MACRIFIVFLLTSGPFLACSTSSVSTGFDDTALPEEMQSPDDAEGADQVAPEDVFETGEADQSPFDSTTPDVSTADAGLDGGNPVDVLVPDVGPDECTVDKCGLACTSPEICGDCGNAICDPGESSDSCPVDCCDPLLCQPGTGPEYGPGSVLCLGAVEGTGCSDGILDNGWESCVAGICRYESPHCHCYPTEVYPDPEIDPSAGDLPPLIELPEWTGLAIEDELFADDWALRRMGVDQAWMVTQGDPEVVVAVIDTGCSSASPDLDGQVLASWDIFEQSAEVNDTNGHGSLMASIVAARVDGQGAVGVAPGVQLLCIKAVPDTGIATYSDLAQGLDWAVSQGADIALFGNGGYGLGEGLAELQGAVEAAAEADVVVVAPTGSGGPSNLDAYPAAFSHTVVSVGASVLTDLPSRDAGLSPDTWLLAPGQGVAGTVGDGIPATRDGSSVSAALVAGVAALVRSADQSLSAEAVRGVLHGQGQPVPLEDFDRLFKARLVHAGAVVNAVADGISDVAVGRLEVTSGQLAPLVPTIAQFKVENRGVVKSATTSVQVSAVGALVGITDGSLSEDDVSVSVPQLEPGEMHSIEFTLSATGDSEQIELSVALDPMDDVAENDVAAISASLATVPVHRTRILAARLVPADQVAVTLTMEALVQNVGTVPEAPGVLRCVHWPSGTEYEVETPALEPGQIAAVELAVEPGLDQPTTRHQLDLYLQPAPGQQDTLESIALLLFRFDALSSEAEQAYIQLEGDNLIADAPWRTTLGKIPVLFFYARTHWTVDPYAFSIIKINSNLRMGYVTVRNPAGPWSGKGPIVYEDHYNSDPDPIPLGAYAVNESGIQMVDGDVVTSPTPVDGAHRILWLPTDQLPNNQSSGMSDPNTTGAFLEVEFRYKTALLQLWYSDRTRRMLATSIDPTPLPKFPGNGHYFDPHFHSIAEWYTKYDPLGPAKAYGGPLWMVTASAAAIGMLESEKLEDAKDKVITTDHNDFFNDDEAPLAGPTAKINWDAPPKTSSKEFDVYRDRLGSTAAEEVTVKGGDSDTYEVGTLTSALGRHALTYRSKHVDGPWGWVWGKLHPPSLIEFLTRITCRNPMHGTPSGPAKYETCLGGTPDKVEGFVFAAHPYTWLFEWEYPVLRQALSLPPYNKSEFLTLEGEFVVRGLQFLNTRQAQKVKSSLFTLGYRDLNPYVGATHDSWFKGWKTWTENCGEEAKDDQPQKDGYRMEWKDGMDKYLNQVRDGLDLTLSDEPTPRDRYFRKLYHLAGSDAHGDFGYTTDICSTLILGFCHTIGQNSIADSAFGRPRTYVYDGSLEHMRLGQSVSTDGPIVEIQFDPESRAAYNAETGEVTWHEGLDSFEDPDGQIGGDGVRDGRRTALVPMVYGNKQAQSFRIKTRCKNIDAFGGSNAGTFELLVSGEAGSGADPKTVSLKPAAKCDGEWQEQNVYLGATAGDPSAMLTGPVAFLAHASFGSGCPGTYDAYTNPIWVSTVNINASLQLMAINEDSFTVQQESSNFPITFGFRQSMLTQQLKVQLKAIDHTTGALVNLGGGADGAGGLQPVGAATYGWDSVPPPPNNPVVKNLKLTYEIPVGKPISGPLTTSAEQQELVLVVTRDLNQVFPEYSECDDARLCDSFGNPLGILAVKVKKSVSCNQQSCGLGWQWCQSQCACKQHYECPPGTKDYGGCECCWSWDCSPLPCQCSYCVSKEDIFSITCPGG
jgi:hypothetical protein